MTCRFTPAWLEYKLCVMRLDDRRGCTSFNKLGGGVVTGWQLVDNVAGFSAVDGVIL